MDLPPFRTGLPVPLLTLLCGLTSLASTAAEPRAAEPHSAVPWHFVVSGDSRNCGDVVMPAIAAGAIRDRAAFYWHLGDFRAIYDFDQDYRQLVSRSGKKLQIIEYEERAWDDFIENQLAPFGPMPVYLGIGNHEVIPPKTRDEYCLQFADWLDTPILKEQRLKDNPRDHRLKTYYHWIQDGIDFINLDNATPDQFDSDQLKWLQGVLNRDAASPAVRTVVVGMHEALPDSISKDHSMSMAPASEVSGRLVYQRLLDLQNKDHKNVYVLASHSHYVMEGTYNTEYWRTHGGVLSGWIIGTAGAVRYSLPENSKDAKLAVAHTYGYLLVTVNPPGQPEGTLAFEFHPFQEKDIPARVVTRFTREFVHECFVGNFEKK